MENRLSREQNSESSLDQVYQKLARPSLSKVACKVHVLEIEWLKHNSATFLEVVIKDD